MGFKVPSFGGANSRNSGEPGEVFQIPSVGVGADADALHTSLASSASPQTITSFNGVAAAVTAQPARQVTLTLSSNANWDATNAVLTGVNHLNETVSENLAIPDGGNATVTSTGYYKSVTSLVIPAQAGAGGTATLGYAAMAALTIQDAIGVVTRLPMKSMVNPTNLYIGPTADGITNAQTLAHYVDGDTVNLLQEGGIHVYVEETVADRDPVYVRIAAGAGGSLLGAFRNDADSGSCVLVPNARFVADSVAGTGVAQAYFTGI